MIHWRVSGPRWTFGLTTDNRGVVIDAAPISQWAVGQPIDRVVAWWRRKGADDIRRVTIRRRDAQTATGPEHGHSEPRRR